MYNTSNFTSANNIAELLTATNGVMDGMLGILILVLVWVFAYMSISDTQRVRVATASFLSTISSGLLLVLGLVTPPVVWIMGAALGLSMVLLYVNARD